MTLNAWIQVRLSTLEFRYFWKPNNSTKADVFGRGIACRLIQLAAGETVQAAPDNKTIHEWQDNQPIDAACLLVKQQGGGPCRIMTA